MIRNKVVALASVGAMAVVLAIGGASAASAEGGSVAHNGADWNQCLDAQVLNGGLTGAVQVFRCNGGPQQRWTVRDDGRVHNGLDDNMCLDAQTLDHRTLTGVVQVWGCNGGPQQHWNFYNDHTVQNGLDYNKFLDAQFLNGGLTGTVQVWDYNGGPQQQWTP